jgi:MFS family permease
MIGRVVLGLGEGSVVVAQRAVISHVFKAKSQVTFAVGVSVAMACLAKTLSRATVVPAANFLGGYVGGLWYTVVVCLLSTLAGVVFIILSDEREDPFERRRNKSVSYAESFLGSPLDHAPIHGQGQGHGRGRSDSGVSVNTKCVFVCVFVRLVSCRVVSCRAVLLITTNHPRTHPRTNDMA